MADPVGAAFLDTALGKAFDLVGRTVRKISFSWRIAYRARALAADDGYSLSLKALRLVTQQKVVKAAVRVQRSADVVETKRLLADVRAVNNSGRRLSADELFGLLRTGYLGAAEQVDRDLGVREEMKTGFESLSIDGGAREPLWTANTAKFAPPLATDAASLRALYGDGIDKLVHELANATDRAALVRSWILARPPWMPAEGRVFGWLGELSFEIDAGDAALAWFDAAIAAAAEPVEYWRVRRVIHDPLSSPEQRGESIADIADHPLVMSLMATEFATRLKHIRRWETSSAMQASLRAALIVDSLLSIHQFDEAIRIGTDEFEQNAFSGAGTNAVEAYLRRSAYQPGAHASDLGTGLALALRIRDARRSWGSSSGVAASKAVKAAIMLSDIDRALAISRPPQATAEEAAHPEVRREAVVTMTLLDDVKGARELIDETTPAWVRLQVESREAELLGDQESANELLSQAIDAADDPNQKAPMCFRLACRGVVHPFVETLRELNPNTVDDLELVAALFRGDAGVEERARKSAGERATVAFPLIEFFESAGRRRDVISIAERAAAVWADPELWLKAARTHFLQGEYSLAIDRVAKALDAGGAEWGNRAAAYMVQIDSASSNGDWTTAAIGAQALIRLRPDSKDAHWALVRIRRSSGDIDLAYREWKLGPSLTPRTPDEAAIWIELFRLNGSDMATLQEFFDLATRFSSDQQIRNLALGALLGSPPITESADELNFGTLLAQFERDFPGQHALKKIEIDEDAEAPEIIEAIQAAMGPRDKNRDALNTALSTGTLPVGFAARYNGRHVAEMLNLRHRAARFAGSLTPGDQDEAISAALEQGTVADVTALFTLAILTDNHAELLSAKFPHIIATSEQMLDASAAREVFSREPGGTFFNGDGEQASFRRDDPIEHDVQRLHSIRLVEWFRRADRQAGRPLTSQIAQQLGGDNEVWLTALDLAARNGTPLWCDDSATRVVATAAGAKSFGTPALVEYLRRNGTLSESLANALDADLIHNWTVGVAYRQAVFDEAGRTDLMSPHGLAIAIRFGGPERANEKIGFIFRAIGAVVALPDQIRDWSSVGFRFVGEITDDSDGAFDNRVKFLHGLLIQPWMTPSGLLFVVEAGREELAGGWAEVFRDGIRRMLIQVSQQTDRATASKYALSLVGQLGENERQIALSVILAP